MKIFLDIWKFWLMTNDSENQPLPLDPHTTPIKIQQWWLRGKLLFWLQYILYRLWQWAISDIQLFDQAIISVCNFLFISWKKRNLQSRRWLKKILVRSILRNKKYVQLICDTRHFDLLPRDDAFETGCKVKNSPEGRGDVSTFPFCCEWVLLDPIFQGFWRVSTTFAKRVKLAKLSGWG